MEITTGNLTTNREQWASIDGYLSYEISWWGRVRNATTGRILKAGRSGSGYLTVALYREGKMKSHSVHVLVAREWVSNPDGKRCVDHMDNDRHNNNWVNLRYATQAENNRNTKKHFDGSSVYKGVSYYKPTGKWMARIYTVGKTVFLGYYANEREAGLAYNLAAVKYFKNFAKLNILED